MLLLLLASAYFVIVGRSLCMMCYLCPKNMFQISIVNFINRKSFGEWRIE